MEDIGIITTFAGYRMQDPDYKLLSCCGVGFLIKKPISYFNCPYCGEEYVKPKTKGEPLPYKGRNS